jgi:ferrochelatase
MRNWNPYLADTLAEMSQAGVRRAIGFIAAAHQSYSSCLQYKENVTAARREIVARGLKDVDITYVDAWFDHPGFIAAVAQQLNDAMQQCPADGRRVLFTAHSIPLEMVRECRYAEQLITSARLVAEKLDIDEWALVYQSRSGRPQDPWLEPDIGDYFQEHAPKGLKCVAVSPIGFVCDHIEVLFDLDHQAAEQARQLGLTLVRARTVNDHPLFIEMMADVISKTVERYSSFPVLPVLKFAS